MPHKYPKLVLFFDLCKKYEIYKYCCNYGTNYYALISSSSELDNPVTDEVSNLLMPFLSNFLAIYAFS
jgi:hypothetical protein